MSSIEIKNLSVTFPDGTKGLNNVDLSIDENEFIALVGPSGSGKTTLLRTIAGFVEPSDGRMLIDAQDVTAVPPEERRLGMVFQQHAVWPHMSVESNVAYPLKMAKLAKAERKRRVEEVLELVGLAGYGKRKPASLSGGQRQRVALARAIVSDPTVLLLDEALSALDEPLRDSLRRELVALSHRRGLTTIHVTHDRAEALSIAQRIVVLDKGEIQQVGTPEEILHHPANPAVAAFISDATVLSSHLDGGTVVCPELGMSWPESQCRMLGGGNQVAVLPESVALTGPGAPGSVRAEVTSTLFAFDHYSVTVKTAKGQSFRTVSPHALNIGEKVGMTVSRPLVY